MTSIQVQQTPYFIGDSHLHTANRTLTHIYAYLQATLAQKLVQQHQQQQQKIYKNYQINIYDSRDKEEDACDSAQEDLNSCKNYDKDQI